ncbi:metalloregulator ArsR/SmtB family transcription factor [Oricola sp.]|uniref:ArsR/SmtB family transcription factor n=1 Tax=Oricola sp. TaxID=1979950 RepID=UPI0025FCCCEA|nr:metalloregulator ArsR/SmtB family transcription factor [Oricola sp.]MCI5077355.1 metalloregulator ArsR/SmtB family transcription factor [Oricola sp.]
MDTETIAERLSALAHPARLAILAHLSGNEGCACRDVVDTLPLAQSTVSQHLKVLLDAGLIIHERQRPRSSYRLNREALMSVSRELNSLIDRCCADNCCTAGKSGLD